MGNISFSPMYSINLSIEDIPNLLLLIIYLPNSFSIIILFNVIVESFRRYPPTISNIFWDLDHMEEYHFY